MSHLILATCVVLGFFALLLAETGAVNVKTCRVAAFALFLLASLIWTTHG